MSFSTHLRPPPSRLHAQRCGPVLRAELRQRRGPLLRAELRRRRSCCSQLPYPRLRPLPAAAAPPPAAAPGTRLRPLHAAAAPPPAPAPASAPPPAPGRRGRASSRTCAGGPPPPALGRWGRASARSPPQTRLLLHPRRRPASAMTELRLPPTGLA